MAPEVERFTEEGVSQSYFCVNLASQEEFNEAIFDGQAIELGGFPDYDDLKFVVIGDKMLVFPDHIRHQDFYNNIKSKLPGTLQCAGLITIEFPQDSSPKRQIYDRSLSLSEELSPEESYWYKLVEIKPKLGQFFEVF